MSLIRKIFNKRCAPEPTQVFAHSDQVSDSGATATLAREELESAVASVAQRLVLFKVCIEPASARTKSQSMLTRSEIDAEELFVIGRRCSGGGRYDYTNSGFQIRDHEPFTVSKRHCAISITENGVLVEDLKSRFGTIVNGKRLGGSENNPRCMVLGRGEHDLVIGRRNSENRFRLIVE